MQPDSQFPDQQPSPPGKAKLIIYVYEGERKIGPIRDNYEVCDFQQIIYIQHFTDCRAFKTTVALCRDMFPALMASPNIGIYTKDLDICNAQLAEIYTESWKDVVDRIEEVVVVDQSRKVEIKDGENCLPKKGIFLPFLNYLT